MLDVCLLGTSGMMPLPGRWLTALMTRYNGSSLLIDCGEGTQIAIKEKGWSFKPIDTLCITHFHADHISGLPGLLLTMGNADRTEPLTIIGPKGLTRVVSSLRIIAPELPFPIRCVELEEPQMRVESHGYIIDAFKVNHAVPCYGYALSIPRIGKFDVEAALARKIPKSCWNRLQHGETVELDGSVYTPDMVVGAPRKGIKVTYCTDTRPVQSIVDNARGADLFICEGMYGDEDKEGNARKHKHMTFTEAANIAKAAQPAQMWLTHYSPSLVRPKDFIKNATDIFKESYVGKDGKSIEIDFTDET